MPNKLNLDGYSNHCAAVVSCTDCTKADASKLLRDNLENVPQPGWVGANYAEHRLLLVGQNPGVPPAHMQAADRVYTKALRAVAADPNPSNMAKLHSVLLEFVPSWPVQRNYFPLAECGLGIQDIAYANGVCCRTEGNAAPGKRLVSACTDRHFEALLDLLQPQAVVCIGKWAHDHIGGLLLARGIPVRFMNRQRSLPGASRAANRRDVVEFVRNCSSGSFGEEGPSAGAEARSVQPDAVVPPDRLHASVVNSDFDANMLTPEDIVESAKKLLAKSLPVKILRKIHHGKAGNETLEMSIRYFSDKTTLRGRNVSYAARIKFLADNWGKSGLPPRELAQLALQRFPMV